MESSLELPPDPTSSGEVGPPFYPDILNFVRPSPVSLCPRLSTVSRRLNVRWIHGTSASTYHHPSDFDRSSRRTCAPIRSSSERAPFPLYLSIHPLESTEQIFLKNLLPTSCGPWMSHQQWSAGSRAKRADHSFPTSCSVGITTMYKRRRRPPSPGTSDERLQAGRQGRQ